MGLGSALSRSEAKTEPIAIDPPDLSGLSRQQLEAMAEAGWEVVECIRVLAKTGDNVVAEALRDGGVYYELQHYPDGDIYDPNSHSQYYYHAHRPGEHGHFHTFLRHKGMPSGVKPVALPGHDLPEDEDDLLCHLIGFSMDNRGVPVRLFTTNLWLTDDQWYPAADVCKMLDHFEMDLARPSWPMNRWITKMFVLFRPQMLQILCERDINIAEWGAKHPGKDAYADLDLDIVSVAPISIDDQIAAVEKALKKSRRSS